MTSTWTVTQIVTLTLVMLGTGMICGIPIGVWIYRLPVDDKRPCARPDCPLSPQDQAGKHSR